MGTVPVDIHAFSDGTKQITVNGMPGWFALPRQWYCRVLAGTGQTEACESADFSGRVYLCVLADDGMTLAYQDPLLEKNLGLAP